LRVRTYLKGFKKQEEDKGNKDEKYIRLRSNCKDRLISKSYPKEYEEKRKIILDETGKILSDVKVNFTTTAKQIITSLISTYRDSTDENIFKELNHVK